MGRRPKENNQVAKALAESDSLATTPYIYGSIKVENAPQAKCERCANCKHLDEGREIEKLAPGIGVYRVTEYLCHRYPASIKKELNDYCGEFARKE